MYTLVVQFKGSNKKPSQYVTEIQDLFELTNLLDKCETVISYKITEDGIIYPSHPAGSQCDKLVTEFKW